MVKSDAWCISIGVLAVMMLVFFVLASMTEPGFLERSKAVDFLVGRLPCDDLAYAVDPA